jgi:hypothetical protein
VLSAEVNGANDGVITPGAGGWFAAPWQIDTNQAKCTPGVGNELLLNPGFETAGGGGADVFANWTETIAGGSTVNDELVLFHAGAHACRLDIDAGNNLARVAQAVAVIGMWYQITVWARSGIAGSTISIGDISGNPNTLRPVTLTVNYVNYLVTTRSQHATMGFSRGSAPGDSIYVDDTTIMALPLLDIIDLIQANTPDGLISVDITRYLGTQVGLVFRIDNDLNPLNGLFVYIVDVPGAINIYLDKLLNGVWSAVANAAIAYVAGAKLVVDPKGSAIRVYYNNILAFATTNNDAAILSNGWIGKFATNSANRFDNFEIISNHDLSHLTLEKMTRRKNARL